jgi:hypothetical protein
MRLENERLIITPSSFLSVKAEGGFFHQTFELFRL